MEGIVLRSIPFEECSRIITLFTPAMGVCGVMMKEVGKKNLALLNITSVLSISEFQLSGGRSELYRLKDAALIDDFQAIRNDLAKLSAAGKMLKAVLKTQLPSNPSPTLYFLLRHYLEKMKSTTNPDNLYLSFYLKLLGHEGLFPAEQSLSPIPFSPEEWDTIATFRHCKSFDALSRLPSMNHLEKKLSELII